METDYHEEFIARNASYSIRATAATIFAIVTIA